MRGLSGSRTALVALVLAAGPLSVGIAQAQLKPEARLGSLFPSKPVAVDPVRAGLIRKAFASCVYHQHTQQVALVLENSDPISINYEAAKIRPNRFGEALGLEFCLGQEVGGYENALGMTFPPSVLRTMLIEEAYLARFSSAPVLPANSVEDVNRTYVSPPDKLDSARGLGTFSDCVVFRNSSGADAVLRTNPDSAAERIAARGLAPTLGDCLVKGQTLALKQGNIRAFVADGLWTRFARNSSSPKTGLK